MGLRCCGGSRGCGGFEMLWWAQKMCRVGSGHYVGGRMEEAESSVCISCPCLPGGPLSPPPYQAIMAARHCYLLCLYKWQEVTSLLLKPD